MKKTDRRGFLKGAVITGAGLALGGGLLYGRRALAALLGGSQRDIDSAIRDHKLGEMTDTEAQAIVEAYMTSEPIGTRVVHVHDPDATNWDFSTGWYGDYVDQQAVDDMVDRGVMELTGASTVAEAWGALLPSYSPGEAIAIKVNFNNSQSCDDGDNQIDALVQPVNAVVRGLKQIGVIEEDIWIYDAVRWIPDRFVSACSYSNVRFFSNCRQLPGWDSDDPDAIVTFNPPGGVLMPLRHRVSNVVINATHLINMPIVKRHSGPGVTLSFKNHFGTIDRVGLHDHVNPDGDHFSTEYSPYVDIYQNPHIGAKTILTLGDGLYGSWKGFSGGPARWKTFGDDASNSLFFASDPVAVDSVMYDFLAAETTIKTNADRYLRVAANAGLGVFEHGDPWGSGYSQIDYRRIDL